MEAHVTDRHPVRAPPNARKVRRWAAVAALAAAPFAVAPALAGASGAEEKRGADLLTEVERGESTCGDLDGDDFDAIGEFVMGRMMGAPQAHEAMDQMMASMMGPAGLERMHEVMGVRFSGCGNPRMPTGFAGMMGAMGMMSDGPRFGGDGGGGMMGFAGNGGDDDDDGPGAWVLLPMLVLIAGGAVVLVIALRPRQRGGATDPRALLDERFARGDLNADEYRKRREFLEGSP